MSQEISKVIDFSKYCSLKVGPKIPVTLIDEYTQDYKNLKVIGFGNNLLISPEASNIGILDDKFDYIYDNQDIIEVGGAVSAQKIYRYFKQASLGGLEFLRALPGSLGGLVKMNAGMKEYEIKNILDSVCIDGQWIDAKNLKLSYRNADIKGIIFGARFQKILPFRDELIEVFEKMRSSHPKKPTCGSCFKNPEGDFAGRLLENVGLRGYQIGQMGFAKEHANFLINLGGGKFHEAMELIELAKKRVFEKFGILLETEVEIIQGGKDE